MGVKRLLPARCTFPFFRGWWVGTGCCALYPCEAGQLCLLSVALAVSPAPHTPALGCKLAGGYVFFTSYRHHLFMASCMRGKSIMARGMLLVACALYKYLINENQFSLHRILHTHAICYYRRVLLSCALSHVKHAFLPPPPAAGKNILSFSLRLRCAGDSNARCSASARDHFSLCCLYFKAF